MSEGNTAKQTFRKTPFGAPHVFVLAVIDGDDTTLVHRLTQTETVVGRGDEIHLVIDDEVVSQRHCLIRTDGGVCTVQDLGSLNGTLLNGRKLRPGVSERVRHLDQIQIGETRLFLLSGRFKGRAVKN